MKYRIDVAEAAEESIWAQVYYLAVQQQSPDGAEKVLAQIWDAIDSLEIWPRRCPLARENDFGEMEIRVQIVGTARLLFTINDDDQSVLILAYRHQRQAIEEGRPNVTFDSVPE